MLGLRSPVDMRQNGLNRRFVLSVGAEEEAEEEEEQEQVTGCVMTVEVLGGLVPCFW
jgi:hypothetical protein